MSSILEEKQDESRAISSNVKKKRSLTEQSDKYKPGWGVLKIEPFHT